MGDGSIYSNVVDLSKWVVSKHKILPSSFWEKAESPRFLTDENDLFNGNKEYY